MNEFNCSFHVAVQAEQLRAKLFEESFSMIEKCASEYYALYARSDTEESKRLQVQMSFCIRMLRCVFSAFENARSQCIDYYSELDRVGASAHTGIQENRKYASELMEELRADTVYASISNFLQLCSKRYPEYSTEKLFKKYMDLDPTDTSRKGKIILFPRGL